MEKLFLSKDESKTLGKAICYLEDKMGSTAYDYEPADMMTGCTCEGNCDGVPSGCTWH